DRFGIVGANGAGKSTLLKLIDGTLTLVGDTPIVIRRKLHIAEPMSIDEALYEMELIGHDFFLFVNKETGRPSVVYHRHGWSYGVFEIDTPENVKKA
ncbi:sigma 54 modulation/S30EA ribosomal C-terminal domain-containing protein, partial [Bifidobacterium longum]|uniref:sigma 54 modulation/S30EA ribosomal C-terminal domain-containing protein n=1 Tax=Bifidobacterium longum TaxID=216816 RepID=UPI0032BFB1A7